MTSHYFLHHLFLLPTHSFCAFFSCWHTKRWESGSSNRTGVVVCFETTFVIFSRGTSRWQESLTGLSWNITSNHTKTPRTFYNLVASVIRSQSSSWFVDLFPPHLLWSMQNVLLYSTCFFISCDLFEHRLHLDDFNSFTIPQGLFIFRRMRRFAKTLFDIYCRSIAN